jgi:hypothetical protein
MSFAFSSGVREPSRGATFASYTFRATGITTYLENGGNLEVAQEEIERIRI